MNRLCQKIYSYRLNHLRWRFIGNASFAENTIIVSPENIIIGQNFSAERDLKLQAWKSYNNQSYNPIIKIGDNVSLMDNCQISCCLSITIGNGCLIGSNVFITDNYHGDNSFVDAQLPPLSRDLFIKGAVEVGNNAWIGRNVCIMPGVIIGDGAIIGANAVVTHNIPAYSIAAGVPAKVIKYLSDVK